MGDRIPAPAGPATARSRVKLMVGIAVAGCLLLVAAANVHLVYVATTSEPGCVPHARLGQSASVAGVYSAAQSACSARPKPAEN